MELYVIITSEIKIFLCFNKDLHFLNNIKEKLEVGEIIRKGCPEIIFKKKIA